MRAALRSYAWTEPKEVARYLRLFGSQGRVAQPVLV